MLASVLPAFHRARSWPESVRAAYEAMFAFAMEEPEYTRLGAVEMFTVGREALRRRDNMMERLEARGIPWGNRLGQKGQADEVLSTDTPRCSFWSL